MSVIDFVDRCFSALQRAENSSGGKRNGHFGKSRSVSVLFSEPKIPQRLNEPPRRYEIVGFSALQRAENSSTETDCRNSYRGWGFSALQRAENSSAVLLALTALLLAVSVLFSEPKIPHVPRAARGDQPRRFQCSSASRKFLTSACRTSKRAARTVSVLFSEPKIPQLKKSRSEPRWKRSFSALQRAENSSATRISSSRSFDVFQCSSASRKFLNRPSHLRPSIFPTAMITLRHS